MNICIVPMRGGSKSLVDKNIKPLSNLPLFYWTLKKLLVLNKNKVVDKIIISSDNDWYLTNVHQYFKEGNKEVLILSKRSDDLSTDIATTEEVCLAELEKHKINEGVLTIVEVTSPLIPVDILNTMIDTANSANIDSSFIVSKEIGQFWRCDGTTDSNWEKLYLDRKMRQLEKQPLYKEVGAWSVKLDRFFNEKNRIVYPNFPIIVDKQFGVSINDADDFSMAEYLMIKYASTVFKDGSDFK